MLHRREVAEADGLQRENDRRANRPVARPARRREPIRSARSWPTPAWPRCPRRFALTSSRPLETPADKRDEVQKYLADKFAKPLEVKPEDDRRRADRGDNGRTCDELRPRSRDCRVDAAAAGARSRRCTTSAPPPATHLLVRGKRATPGPARSCRASCASCRAATSNGRRRRPSPPVRRHQRPPAGAGALADRARHAGQRRCWPASMVNRALAARFRSRARADAATISAARVNRRPTPSCSNGWPPSSSPTAGA